MSTISNMCASDDCRVVVPPDQDPVLDDELPEQVPAAAEHGMDDQPLERVQVPDPVSPPPEMPGVAQSPFSVASYDSDATVPVPIPPDVLRRAHVVDPAESPTH